MPRFKMYPLRANNILQLYEWKDQIDLDPPYQRFSIWDEGQQQCFIDSILNGFDVPKLYFYQIPPTPNQTGKYRYAVIDGKQRLYSLWRFMENELSLPKNFIFYDDESIEAGGAKYDELMSKFPRLRARFDGFDLPVTVVQTDDTDFIDDLFSRLNIQVSLSAGERRNALGGPLPFVIQKIGFHAFFQQSVRITNKRRQHFDLAAKFLYLTYVNSIESTKKKMLDEFVTKFREYRDMKQPEASPEHLQSMQSNTTKIMDKMNEFFDHKDPLLASQGRMTLYFHIFRICQESSIPVPFTKQTLEQFNDELTAARKKSQRLAAGTTKEPLSQLEQILVYFDREKQSPNDAGAIKRQYDYMSEYFQSVFKVSLPSYNKSS
ncbi:MAG: DUF262 domain-containing protein [Dehalococcoidia bacterium]